MLSKKTLISFLIVSIGIITAAHFVFSAGYQPVSPPSNVWITVVSSTSLRLDWADNSDDEDYFYIERSVSDSSYSYAGTADANSIFYTDTGLSPNTKYAYRIKACRTYYSESICSSWAYAENNPKYTFANKPTGLNYIWQDEDNRVDWGWSKPPNSDGNPDGTEYYARDSTTGNNSGWIKIKNWSEYPCVSTREDPSVHLDLYVKAKNEEGVETEEALLENVNLECHLPPPKNIYHTSNTVNSITWAWQQSYDEDFPIDGYTLFKRGNFDYTTGKYKYVPIGETTCSGDNECFASQRRFTWAGLSPNTSYTLYINSNQSDPPAGSVIVPSNDHPYTSIESATGHTCSATPNSITITADGTFTNLTSGSSGMYFESNSGHNSGWLQTTSWTDIGLLPGSTYVYYITTRNGDGDENAKTGPYTCTTPSPADTTAPTVTSLSVNPDSICSGDSSTISWTSTDNVGVSWVEVWELTPIGWYRISSGGCAGNQPANGSCTVYPTSASNIYGIHAVDSAGNCIDETGAHCGGVTSDSLDPRTAVGPDSVTVNTAPSVPGNPSYSNTGQTSTQVSWSAASGADSYNLYRFIGSSSLTTYTNVTSPYTDSGLTCGTTYRYWVKAINSCGGTFSNQGTSVTTAACDPNAPSISFDPASRSWDDSNVSVTVTASDDSGVIYTRHCWTTSSSCDPGTSSSSTFVNGASVSQTTNGNWNLCIRAMDGDDNWNSVPVCSGRYQIDKNAPTVDAFSVNSQTNDFSTQHTSLSIAWIVSDTGGSGLNRVEVWCRTDSDSWDQVNTEATTTGSWIDNVTCGHSYEYGIHAVDNASNIGYESSTITATVNCLPPGNNNPNNPTNLKQFGDDVGQMSEGDSTTDSTPYFTFDISDPDSGDIVGYQIQIDDSDSFITPVIDYTWPGGSAYARLTHEKYSTPGGLWAKDSSSC